MSVPSEVASYLSEKLTSIIDGESEEFKKIVNRTLESKIYDLAKKMLGYSSYSYDHSEYDQKIMSKLKTKLDKLIDEFEYIPSKDDIRQLQHAYNNKMYNLLKVQAEAQATEDFNKHKDQLNG